MTLLAMVGRGGEDVVPKSPVLSSTSPSFGIVALPSSVSFPVGSSITTDINLTSINSFSGAVSLAATVSNASLANRPTAVLTNPTLQLAPGGMNSTIMTVFTTSLTPSGFYTVNVTGTSGTLTNSTVVRVGVQDFSISANPTSLTLPEGYSGTSLITLTAQGGFNGSVSLLSKVSPSGPTISLSRVSVIVSTVSGNSTLTVSTAASTPAGSYTVNVTGAFGPIVHSAVVMVSVTGFTLSASPNGFSMAAGSSSSPTVNVASANGFAGTVSLGVSVSPSGPSVSLTAGSVTLSTGNSVSVTVNISTMSSAPPGFYTVNVTGTSGLQVHSLYIPVAIGSISVTVNSVSNFTGVTVKTSGTLSVNSPSNTLTVSGAISILATNATTRAMLFSFTYNITGYPIGSQGMGTYKVLFLLDVVITPYALSSDITITFQGTSTGTTVGVTRNVDIDLDGFVDKKDSDIWAASNGCSFGMTCYNPRADFYAIGTVNLSDLTLISFYLGATDFIPIISVGAAGGSGRPPLRY